MKLGLVSAILDGWDLEGMLAEAKAAGYSCVEVACWPAGKAERRYAGVSHIDVCNTSEEYIRRVKDLFARYGLTISALAFYPNPLDPEKGPAAVEHLYHVIEMSALLGVNLVTTFIGRDQTETVEENLELVKTVWPPVLEYAREKGVRIAIENCPMLFGSDQWPGGQNLFTSPANWKKVLEVLPYDNLGINYDPSHFIWQMMDYIAPIYQFRDRIFHVHIKDIKLYRDRLNQVGSMAYPLDFMSPKLPGLGDVDWGRYISALTDIGYDGPVCVEVEDKAFEGTREKIVNSIRVSRRYIEQFVL
ncbi:sugar phosphate isomerase/epimerase family protein [Flavonifractor sp. An306]|uniref:sugar phosphate isomerase/epimerase family protein n=1 Tax=Flavonifractor sp. An306 TaxID=1965629 RepID=UPI001748D3E0|nr:sugar phosphate isomerase/epimerase [Flavonifractor sp. An306]